MPHLLSVLPSLRFLRRQRTITLVILFFLAFTVYYALNIIGWRWYVHADYRTEVVCEMSDEDYDSLIDMAERLTQTLTKYNIKYWLAYGSLIGAMRYQGPIPWDTDMDVGIEWNTAKDYFPDKIIEIFEEKGLTAHYQWWGGFIRVTNNRSRSDIMLFTDYWGNGWMNRMGIESWVLIVNYWNYHAFPAALVRDPLPYYNFGRIKMAATHNGTEMMKYQYPDDWQKEVRPHGCESAVFKRLRQRS